MTAWRLYKNSLTPAVAKFDAFLNALIIAKGISARQHCTGGKRSWALTIFAEKAGEANGDKGSFNNILSGIRSAHIPFSTETRRN